jgi:Tol biopolymer transport system component
LLTFLSGTNGEQAQLLWKDRFGKVLGNLGERIPIIGNVAISPDQKSVAVGFGTVQDLWIYDAARGLPTRFTFDPAIDREPVWSPDGKTLYFVSARGKGNFNVYRKASNGTGAEELLLEDAVDKSPTSFSPDGRLLLYSRNDPKTASDIWVLPLTQEAGGAKPEPRVFLQTPFNEARPQFSPDGQWVTYESNDSGQREVYAAPFPGPGGKRQISSGGGVKPRWRKDGEEIFYHTEEGQLMAAEVIARNGTLEVGKVQKLFDGIGNIRGYLYDVSADGQRFLVADEGAATARPLTLLQNWTATLRK